MRAFTLHFTAKGIGIACLFVTLLCGVASCPARAEGKKWAILIGINAYDNPDIQRLEYAVADAKALADTLTSRLGYEADHVCVLTSDQKGENRPTAVHILKRLDALAAHIAPDDTLVFYFSGHGFQFGADEEAKNFLGTIDTDDSTLSTLNQTALSLENLKGAMRAIKAHQVVYIIDACRNDLKSHARVMNFETHQRTRAFTKALEKTAVSSEAGAQGTAILFACQVGEKSYEAPEFLHGAFTHYLLQGLQGRAMDANMELTINDLADYVDQQLKLWGDSNGQPQRPELIQFGSAAKIVLAQGRPNPPPTPIDGGNVVVEATTAHLDIVTDPPGAQIYLGDNAVAGKRTPAVLDVELGVLKQKAIEIGLHLDGYKDRVLMVTLERGKRTPIMQTLEQTVAPQPGPKPVPVPKPDPQPAPIPVSGDGTSKINLKDGAEMVFIPAGAFLMGDDDSSVETNNPRHTVTLSGYYIYKNLVTVGQYKKFCQETGRKMPRPPDFDPRWKKDDHPIVNVSWDDAHAYCVWAGAQLPTEAQWEKAARGTDGRLYPWGNRFDHDKLWCSTKESGDAGGTVEPVGVYADSPYGLSDMAGNVSQWCSDYYEENFWRHGAEAPDPENTTPGRARVRRGNSWEAQFEFWCRVSLRVPEKPGAQRPDTGFRCVTR